MGQTTVKMVRVHFNTLQIVFCKANAPATWPGVMSRNGRDFSVQAGAPTTTTGVFPENESDETQLSKFHCKRVLPTSEAVGRLWLLHSAW